MNRLNAIIAPALVAALGFGLAAPAMAKDSHRDGRHNAQDYRHDAAKRTPVRYSSVRNDIRNLYQDIARSERRGAISHREAARLRSKARDLDRSYTRFSRNGLTRWEIQRLERDVREVRIALRSERFDRDRRRG